MSNPQPWKVMEQYEEQARIAGPYYVEDAGGGVVADGLTQDEAREYVKGSGWAGRKYRTADGRILQPTENGTWDVLDDDGYPVDDTAPAYEAGLDGLPADNHTGNRLPGELLPI